MIVENFRSRKLLQTNSSSSSFDASQPSFIALLSIIAILTVALVITIVILCYRYYSPREPELKPRPKKRRRILSEETKQQTTAPASVTPTSVSSFSGRSSAQLLSDQRRQNVSINTLPSRRFEQSMVDAYLNDLPSFQPATIDVKKLNSYLFIDLHSTSSETFPENISKQVTNNNTKTSGYTTSTEDESQKRHRYYVKNQQRYRTTSKSKRSHRPRFLMRERSLPNNLHTLPQLRQITTQQQRRLFEMNDTNNSSTTIVNPDLQSTTVSTTTDEYDDSHAYNVTQNQILQTIKEGKSFFTQPYFPDASIDHEQEPYFFEIVSTSRDDSSELHIPYISSPIIGNRLTYINDSIIV